jgi:hypothetical protein
MNENYSDVNKVFCRLLLIYFMFSFCVVQFLDPKVFKIRNFIQAF